MDIRFPAGEFQGKSLAVSLAGYSLWSHKESDTTEWLTLPLSPINETRGTLYWPPKLKAKQVYYIYPSFKLYIFSSVQLLIYVWLFVTPWNAAHQASLSITNSWSLLKLMSIEMVMPSYHLILCHPCRSLINVSWSFSILLYSLTENANTSFLSLIICQFCKASKWWAVGTLSSYLPDCQEQIISILPRGMIFLWQADGCQWNNKMPTN